MRNMQEKTQHFNTLGEKSMTIIKKKQLSRTLHKLMNKKQVKALKLQHALQKIQVAFCWQQQ